MKMHGIRGLENIATGHILVPSLNPISPY